MDEDHFLATFLGEKLPTLGLDPETYGPYLLGLLPADDSGDGADDDEWDGVLELLQASSESHSDDVNAWQDLKKELQERYQKYLAEEKQRKAEEDAKRLEEAKLAAASVPTETPKEETHDKKSSAIDDEAKKIMLARYAYEDPDEEEGEGGRGGNVNENKASAEKQSMEMAKDARKQKVQTKKEEQQKTKQAKQDKIKLKEDRRKRATKGERRR